jgi:endo-1,4-beta-xylanase
MRPTLVLAAVCAAALHFSPPANAADTLRELAAANGIHFGAAVDVEVLQKDVRYAQLLAREFDLVTPENAMKFEVIHPERDQYDFTEADALVDFAEQHGMQVNGHVLVWDQQLPDWLAKGHFSRDELKTILHDHIRTLVSRYRGRVVSWDVAAEAVGEDGKPRETFWSRGIGPDYLELAFRWAREADPDVHLRYNDYGGEGMGVKSQGIYDLVDRLVKEGVPIDGVGLQMHLEPDDAPDPKAVRDNMQRLAALGLETYITEMDVSLPMPERTADLATQTKLYRDMLQACLSVPQCRSFSTWGVTDRYSWIPEFFPGHGAALLFDRDYRPKPAYYGVRRLLRGAASMKRVQTGGPDQSRQSQIANRITNQNKAVSPGIPEHW